MTGMPFAAGVFDTPRGPLQTYYMDVCDRLRWVAQCSDADLLRLAMEVAGLQKSVRSAIERRLKKLAREGASHD